MKLTKIQTDALRAVLRNLERSEAYLFSDAVRVCRAADRATTVLDYVPNTNDKEPRRDLDKSAPQALTIVQKTYGSDLCLYLAASNALASFVVLHGFKSK